MRDRISSSGNKVRENKNSLHEKLIQSEHKMVSANMTAEKGIRCTGRFQTRYYGKVRSH